MDARDEKLLEVKMYQSNGWDLKEETPEWFLLKRNEASLGGHVLVFLLTFWFTLGIGNLIYWLASNKTKKIVK
jgi:hypothetical protein